jgi:hypothetical protein
LSLIWYGDLPEIFSFNPLRFAVIDPNFYSMALFRILFAIIVHYAGRSDSLRIICRQKGRSRQFFEPLDSVQESSEPLFLASFSCRTNTRAFYQAASSGTRSQRSVVADMVICPVQKFFSFESF